MQFLPEFDLNCMLGTSQLIVQAPAEHFWFLLSKNYLFVKSGKINQHPLLLKDVKGHNIRITTYTLTIIELLIYRWKTICKSTSL